MVKKKMASASMQALDAKIQNYKDILGIHKKAEVIPAEPVINPSQEVGNNVASTVDKLVDRIEAAINEVKELGDKPDSTEKAEEQVQSASASTEQEVKKESSETGETTVKDTSKEDTSEEDKEAKEAVLKIRRIVAHSTKLAKLQIAQKLADARNFEKTAGVNPAALATLAAILGIGGGVYAGTRNPNMILDLKSRFGGEKPAAPAPQQQPAVAAAPRTVTLPMPNKEPVRIPASTETPDKFSQDALKAYKELEDPKSADRLFDFETDPREFKGSDIYGGIPTSEIKDLEAVDAANQNMRESGLVGGLTEREINEYLKEHEEDMARQNTISAQRDFLNAEKEDFYGNQPAETPQNTEEGSLFDAAADPAMAEKGKEYLKEIDPEQETMSRKLESLDDEALGKLARTNPKMLAALLGALGITGAGAGAYALSRGGETAPSADGAAADSDSLLSASIDPRHAEAFKAGQVDDKGNLKAPTDMLRESGVEIGANGEQRPIDNFQDPNSGETLDYDAVSKELEDYIKGQQEGDTGVMPWEKGATLKSAGGWFTPATVTMGDFNKGVPASTQIGAAIKEMPNDVYNMIQKPFTGKSIYDTPEAAKPKQQFAPAGTGGATPTTGLGGKPLYVR